MDYKLLDGKIDLMLSKLDLSGQTCSLKHSREDPAENHPAVEYLCQDVGQQEDKTILQQMRIPICEECAEALHDPNWILVYCVYCNKSQWIFRPKAKREYPKGNLIYWTDVCPFCAEVANEWKEKE